MPIHLPRHFLHLLLLAFVLVCLSIALERQTEPLAHHLFSFILPVVLWIFIYDFQSVIESLPSETLPISPELKKKRRHEKMTKRTFHCQVAYAVKMYRKRRSSSFFFLFFYSPTLREIYESFAGLALQSIPFRT